MMGADLSLFASPAHLDPTVRTGIPRALYTQVPILRLAGRRAFLQWGGWSAALNAESTVVDLNPRSISAWLFLLLRRVLRRRTLVWGHLHPRAGSGSRTAWLRTSMRKLAHGTILYTYENESQAQEELPGQPVWVAPNSLYRRAKIETPTGGMPPVRSVVYVGRFEPAKKVELIIRGFALFLESAPEAVLSLVGDGSQRQELEQLVSSLGIGESVTFHGWVNDYRALAAIYQPAFSSVSAGFAGLGLTQSLGFGVPMIIAKNEPHSPEIELADESSSDWFDSNSPESLSTMLLGRWQRRDAVPIAALSARIRARYSAEAMAAGLANALTGTTSKTGVNA